MAASNEDRLTMLEAELAQARNGKLPMTGGGWSPTFREARFLKETVYLVNLEVTGREKMKAEANGVDSNTIPPWVVEIGTTVALQQARASKWEKFQNGVSLGVESIFRDATKEEIAAYKIRKEAAIEKRNAEVAKDELRNAPKVVIQQMAAAPEKKGK